MTSGRLFAELIPGEWCK